MLSKLTIKKPATNGGFFISGCSQKAEQLTPLVLQLLALRRQERMK